MSEKESGKSSSATAIAGWAALIMTLLLGAAGVCLTLYGEQWMINAIKSHDFERAKFLLSFQESWKDSKVGSGETILKDAMDRNDHEAVLFLIQRGARLPKNHEQFMLQWAAAGNPNAFIHPLKRYQTKQNIAIDHTIARWALDAGADPNDRITLPLAVSEGKAEIVQLLLKAGADPNAQPYEENEITTNGRILYDHYSSYIIKGAPLCLAEEPEIIQILLEGGANPNLQNKLGCTPLCFASSNAYQDKALEIIELLLEGGADPNIGKSPLLGLMDKKISTLLVPILLKAGANPNIIDENGATPLHLIAIYNDLSLTQELLKYGAHIDARDNFQKTPLHIAVIRSSEKYVEQLLKQGADPNTRDAEGKTPLHISSNDYRTGRGYSINLACRVDILLKGGANPNIQDNLGNNSLHTLAQDFGIVAKHWEIRNRNSEKYQDLFRKNGAVYDFIETIAVLLKYGVDPARRNNLGQTPSEVIQDEQIRGFFQEVLTLAQAQASTSQP
jgi:ankyrin repeat protein